MFDRNTEIYFGENMIFGQNYSVSAKIIRFSVCRQACFGAKTAKIAEGAQIPKPKYYSVVHYSRTISRQSINNRVSIRVTRVSAAFQVRESKRQYADLESRMTEAVMMARIRDAENTQRVAELTQKISGLECKVGRNESSQNTPFFAPDLVKQD